MKILLINNDGAPPLGPSLEFSDEDWVKAIDQNFMSVLRLTRQAVPHMRKQGAGWIVNLGSSTSITPNGPPYDDYTTHGGAALYAALKTSIHRLSISLAAELLADNIAVNVVAPVGAILTPGVEALGVITEETKAYVEAQEHIAEAALALARVSISSVMSRP